MSLLTLAELLKARGLVHQEGGVAHHIHAPVSWLSQLPSITSQGPPGMFGLTVYGETDLVDECIVVYDPLKCPRCKTAPTNPLTL